MNSLNVIKFDLCFAAASKAGRLDNVACAFRDNGTDGRTCYPDGGLHDLPEMFEMDACRKLRRYCLRLGPQRVDALDS